MRNAKLVIRLLKNVLIALLITHYASRITLAWADFNSSSRGTAAADFLTLGAGARAGAMGDAYSAVADEATALYWNPGALTRIPEKSASATLMHAPYVASSFYDYVGFAKNGNGTDAWGTSLQYFSAGAITETDANGFDQGSFTPYDLAVSAGYAHKFQPFSVGFSAKFIRSQIIASAQTAAADFGIVSAPLWNDRLRLAGVVTNVGGKMKFEQESNRLPMAYRLGSALQITRQWKASLDAVAPIDDRPYLAAGTEYLWPVGRNWNLAGRAGVNTQRTQDLGGLAGVSFGLGMDFDVLAIDYALQPMGDLGLTHRLSISFRFQPSLLVSPKRVQGNLRAPSYPDYQDQAPYFDDSPSLRDKLE